MSAVRSLKALQLDALREVANIGAGHAATALSQMTDRSIMISIPEINVTRYEDAAGLLGDPSGRVIAVFMHMLGDLTGRTLLLLPDADARLLCDLLMRKEPGSTTSFNELEESSLKEAGNILGGAYLNALSDFMGMMLLPSVPTLVADEAAVVLKSALAEPTDEHDTILCVETEFFFREAEQRLLGHFLLLPDGPSLQAIFDAIRVN